ncbi:hypothetical protein ABWJ92_34035 [Streptomyces sp. NPDC000609]|uniref:hypothetical protein n=1 Tax=Streptomyces sp. NPDC000609 TaxID=3160957 RepID=UPI00339AC2F1
MNHVGACSSETARRQQTWYVFHREALCVLRDSSETAHIDACSDIAWPREVAPAYEQVLSMAANEVADGVRSAKGDPGMGIDIDVRDDTQFDVLLALAPYTIHAEAWRQPGTV